MEGRSALGIMQPYFFPYIGYFSLIAATDAWVVFDISQYTPKTWMNRNRILHPTLGWQYITVPLSNSSISIITSEARIRNISKAKDNTLGKLTHYKKKAPYFDMVRSLVSSVFDTCDDDSLVKLNVRGLVAVCRYLDIPFHYNICSEMNLPFPDKMGPGDWAPHICSFLRFNRYINPVGGKALFDSDEFAYRGISLSFMQPAEFIYDTAPFQYIANLSILDVLMWNSPSEVKRAVLRVRPDDSIAP
jgi:hypothetical protein